MRRLSIIVAVFAFFAMTAVAFAANTANISVTSEPIKQAATCDKAGGFAITWDDGSTFVSGDQITFDLPLNVTLCKAINMLVGDDAGQGDASGFNDNLPVQGSTSSPLTASSGSSITTVNGGVTFQIIGAANSSRVTINVMGDSDGDGSQDSLQPAGVTPRMTFAQGTAGDVIELAFLDQVVYTGTQGIYELSTDTPSAYDDPVELEDNTLCINVSAYANDTVNASFDSKNDKFTWIPSNPQIAHVVNANTLAFEACSKAASGNIVLPGTASQGSSSSCNEIENEAGLNDSYAGTANGFCTSTHRNNKAIIRTSDGTPFDSADYSLTLTILVDGATGDNGVYFTDAAVGTEGYDTLAAACADTSATANTGTLAYLNAAGGTLGTPAADTDCDLAAANKAVQITVTATDLNLNQTTNDYLWIDIPSMIIGDTSLFTSGKELSVRIQMDKAPCGEVFNDVIVIGTAGCDATTATDTLTFPYFGKTVGGSYVSAIVIDNMTASDGTVTLTMREADGDTFVSSAISVSAYGMLVKSITDASFGWTNTVLGTGSAGVVGDSKCFITTSSTFTSSDGCALITNATTGESISYLPRQ